MSQAANSPNLTCRRLDGKDYGITNNQFDRRAVNIVKQINQAGFDAYLVGGCIRDLLLGLPPKDFDIATNARPEEVAGLFRNCRLIGRRFRLAHIHFGRDIIEVATFRASPDQEQRTDAHGHVLEDNHYGHIEDDVVRRDFTVNALYYDVRSGEILDYLNVMDDIEAKRIAMIGDPEARYTEDPVRMLRAARFAAKLNMTIEPKTQAAIAQCRDGIKAVPAARLFDEAQKLFMGGYGERCFASLQEHDLFTALFPDTASVFEHQQEDYARYAQELVRIALANTDQRIAEGRPVTIAFLLAAILWPVYQLAYQGLFEERDNWHAAMHEAVDVVHLAAAERLSIPVRLRGMIREIWTLQARFDLAGRSTRKMQSLLSHPRFRAAYDFLLIRHGAGEPLDALVDWWTALQQDNDLMPSHDEKPRPKKRRSRGGRKRRGDR
ncbi:polynucleotide adenylyltransferase PcnB [Suttonella sp. R2A3]|uniref:polynucleotide adenylyltransferase PcnB n=1 Tax=Suttonella sp. R2A3 TaxID=2908648 RepID=UPI001F2158B9|nr:polynucleotide adenylyltransferase PcnB [Suttonella sp. R2A3]UJF25124.1 polynucleotide adenylyltransferase PcnB [Suttonella sp. R2A3]